MAVLDRFKNAWNVFMNKEPPNNFSVIGDSRRPDRMYFGRGAERSIVNAVYNRIAIDVASCGMKHVRLDENETYIETIDDGLNNCLILDANKDQTARAFIQSLVITMFQEGCAAAVPIDTDVDPAFTDSYDIWSIRVGEIKEWKPDTVKISVYNDRDGNRKDVEVQKRTTAIIENPFYMVMNEPNSTVQRLTRKLSILDSLDSKTGSDKFNMIFQLPYELNSPRKKQLVEQRIKDVERQLSNSKYGIAYADATEHVIQLNRPLENNLMAEVESLLNLFYSQMGITPEIMNGTADEKTMNNYYKRTIEPILAAITDEFKRKFLSKTARTQGQSIFYFINPFKLVTTTDLPDLADKMTRNEIMTPNEFRQIVGLKPSLDPKADELRNRNISMPAEQDQIDVNGNLVEEGTEESEE